MLAGSIDGLMDSMDCTNDDDVGNLFATDSVNQALSSRLLPVRSRSSVDADHQQHRDSNDRTLSHLGSYTLSPQQTKIELPEIMESMHP